MGKLRTTLTALAVGTGAVVSLVTGASASAARIEGEDAARTAGRCSPAGERMATVHAARASEGQALLYPHRGCWAEWTFSLEQQARGVVLASRRVSGNRCARWDVSVDGGPVVRSGSPCGARAMQLVDVRGLFIPPGDHTIRVTARQPKRWSSANVALDYLELDLRDIPGAPEGPTAESGPGLGEITVRWQPPGTDGGAGVEAFRVYRAEQSGGPHQLVAEVTGGLTYTDTGLTPGLAFYYRVSALNEVGEGPKSSETSASASTGTGSGAPLEAPVSNVAVPTEISSAEFPSAEALATEVPRTFRADVPATTLGTSLPGQEASVPSRSETTPALETPATCSAEPCATATTVSGTTPQLGGGSGGTPEVPRTCAPALCVGPVPAFQGGERPSIPPQTLTATVTPLCEIAPGVCLGGMTLLPGQTVSTPGAGPLTTPGLTVLVAASGFVASVEPLGAASTAIGPIDLAVPLPRDASIPVTICPDVCSVPLPADGSLSGEFTITVASGDIGDTVSVPVNVDL
ncbi:MAG TPA: fibronectin type III domain-containing protein [Actinomycetota bacterium]|nr:fibronectin type III domain-containing protein [Actinomycetota bacterium]